MSLPIPQSLPASNNNNDIFGFPTNTASPTFDPSQFQNGGLPAQFGQPDLSYYGMAPTMYMQNEDIIMDTTAAPYQYPTGAVWNSA